MKVIIGIWKSDFTGEWNFNITQSENGFDSQEYWAVNDYSKLLKLIEKKFPETQLKLRE